MFLISRGITCRRDTPGSPVGRDLDPDFGSGVVLYDGRRRDGGHRVFGRLGLDFSLSVCDKLRAYLLEDGMHTCPPAWTPSRRVPGLCRGHPFLDHPRTSSEVARSGVS